MPKPGPRTTRRYSPSFKATAVRLSPAARRARAGCRGIALHSSLHAVSLAQAGARGFGLGRNVKLVGGPVLLPFEAARTP